MYGRFSKRHLMAPSPAFFRRLWSSGVVPPSPSTEGPAAEGTYVLPAPDEIHAGIYGHRPCGMDHFRCGGRCTDISR